MADRDEIDGEVTLTGELAFVELEGGYWQLTFGGPDDRWGGRVVLGRPAQLRDRVPDAAGAGAGEAQSLRAHVRGRAREETMSIFMAGTMFEVSSIELL